MDKLRAAIYVRVSTEDQATEGYSIDAQQHELLKFCESKDMECVGIYSDEGKSGKDIFRPELMRLFDDASAKTLDVVLIWDTTRLSRDVSDIGYIIKKFRENSVDIISVTQGIDTRTDEGILQLQFFGSFGEYERKKIIKRARMGQEEKARQGGFIGGLLYGYDSINGNLVINEKEAEIIRTIFNWYVEGKGMVEIRDILNNWGVKTKKGKHFTEHAIRYMLTNKKYIGMITFGKFVNCSDLSKKKLSDKPIESEGKHEAIIAVEIFNKAQEIFNAKKFKNKRGRPSVHLLSGFLACPVCGEKMYHYYGKPKEAGKKTYHYYACSVYKKLRKCVNNHIRADIVENAVMERIKEIVSDEKVISDVVNKINSGSNVNFDLVKKQLESIDIELRKLENSKEKLMDDYIDGHVEVQKFNELTERVEVKISSLVERKKAVEIDYNVACNSVIDYKDVYTALKNFDALYEFIDNKDRKRLMKSLIYQVSLNKDWTFKDIEFKFSVPNRNISDEAEEGAKKANLKVVTNEDTVRRIINERRQTFRINLV